jgi:hypothetical protein
MAANCAVPVILSLYLSGAVDTGATPRLRPGGRGDRPGSRPGGDGG